MTEREKELREKMRALVKEFYQEVHLPQQKRTFIPGESRLTYGGRIFDHEEMTSLMDASLDFWLTSGRYTDEFESRLAQCVGAKWSLLVNSGSSANLLAFSALTSPLLKERRLMPGDEVITVAAGFPTTVNPTIQFGAIPVFVDVTVDDGTYNIDVTKLEEALSPKTRAIMVAHTLGNPIRLKEITDFCRKHNLWFIEDNCDALGSQYDGKNTGSFGDLGTSSFYPPHHLTMGEGGAVYTSQPLLKRAAESFRDWGRDCWCPSGKDNTCKKRFGWELGELPKGYDHKYVYRHFGYNLKATDMQAAIGCRQLDKLSSFTQARRNNFSFLREALSDLEDYFVLPNPTENSEPSWFGFILSVRANAGFTRHDIVSFLESKNIQTRMLFAGNYLLHPAFDEMRKAQSGYRVIGDLKNTNRVMNETFWLGVYPGINQSMLDYMVEQLRSFVKR